MIFTSYTYVAFLGLVFVLHWSAPEAVRKPLLVAASYAFYCSWKWPYGFLLLGVSLFNWAWGRFVVARSDSSAPLAAGISVNLLPLIYFKYSGFLVANAAAVAGALGATWHPSPVDIVLPLGISFFTFQGIAYLVDVASGDPPFASLPDFLLYKGFWPQLIAGPIIRPGEIREQIEGSRAATMADLGAGVRRILFGLVKKVCIADTLAPFADAVYAAGVSPAAADAAFGTLAFGLQIYFDFSAYSDIAIGSARLFGFRFPENFDWPYLSRSPQEFWTRWHMTLSRWIRDYVFTPLTFAARRRPRTVPLWILLAMALCGLWHGARWTFVAWGLWHGLLLVANEGWNRLRASSRLPLPSGPAAEAVGRLLTVGAVTLGWILFRAGSLGQAASLLEAILTFRGGIRPAVLRENALLIIGAVAAGTAFAQAFRLRLASWGARFEEDSALGAAARGIAYAVLLTLVVVLDHEAQAFVYFQF